MPTEVKIMMMLDQNYFTHRLPPITFRHHPDVLQSELSSRFRLPGDNDKEFDIFENLFPVFSFLTSKVHL